MVETGGSRWQRRDSVMYKYGLFPEAPSGIEAVDFLVRFAHLSERTQGKFYFLDSDQTTTPPKKVSLTKIIAETGGQKSFFKAGASILNIGSGAGIGDAQLSVEFPNVKFVGIDHGYMSRLRPVDRGKANFTGGDWNKLPFKDNSFTGIMALESFPKHAEWIWDYAETFKEVTRVSKHGAVWRGTHAGSDHGQKVYEDDWGQEMLKQMNENGWDVYVAKTFFVAKLVNKK